jgi:hypothetical protein
MRFLFRITMFAAIALTLTAIGSARSMAENVYELAVIPPPETGGGISVYRINVVTGQVTNASGFTFSDISDSQPVPPGRYRLYFAQTPDQKTFWLYRLETQTGRMWFFSNSVWTEITQPK